MSNTIKLAIIGVLTMIVGGIVGFHIMETWKEFFGEKSVSIQKYSPSRAEQTQKEEVTKWRIFQNKNYHFIFEYPETLKVEEKSATFLLLDIPPNSPEKLCAKNLVISVYPNKKCNSIKSFKRLSQNVLTKTEINGIEYYKEETQDCGMGLCNYFLAYWTDKNDNCYKLTINLYQRTSNCEVDHSVGKLTNEDKLKELQVFNQIFSTFHFSNGS